MTSKTYLSAAVVDRLAEAQRLVDLHLVLSRMGRCRLCQQLDPCDRRVAAERFMLRYGRLPRRTPGLALAPSPRSQMHWT